MDSIAHFLQRIWTAPFPPRTEEYIMVGAYILAGQMIIGIIYALIADALAARKQKKGN